MAKVKGTECYEYFGVMIMPADRNGSGIRYTARLEDGTRFRADTLDGIKQLIRDAMKER